MLFSEYSHAIASYTKYTDEEIDRIWLEFMSEYGRLANLVRDALYQENYLPVQPEVITDVLGKFCWYIHTFLVYWGNDDMMLDDFFGSACHAANEPTPGAPHSLLRCGLAYLAAFSTYTTVRLSYRRDPLLYDDSIAHRDELEQLMLDALRKFLQTVLRIGHYLSPISSFDEILDLHLLKMRIQSLLT